MGLFIKDVTGWYSLSSNCSEETSQELTRYLDGSIGCVTSSLYSPNDTSSKASLYVLQNNNWWFWKNNVLYGIWTKPELLSDGRVLCFQADKKQMNEHGWNVDLL